MLNPGEIKELPPAFEECDICKSLGSDCLCIHMAFSQKTNGFWKIISLFCCEQDGSVAPTWNLLWYWGTRSVYHAYADAEYQSCIPRWQEHIRS
jgi:hypothetical protein